MHPHANRLLILFHIVRDSRSTTFVFNGPNSPVRCLLFAADESDVTSCGNRTEGEGFNVGIPCVKGCEIKPWGERRVSECIDRWDGELDVFKVESGEGGKIFGV